MIHNVMEGCLADDSALILLDAVDLVLPIGLVLLVPEIVLVRDRVVEEPHEPVRQSRNRADDQADRKRGQRCRLLAVSQESRRWLLRKMARNVTKLPKIACRRVL